MKPSDYPTSAVACANWFLRNRPGPDYLTLSLLTIHALGHHLAATGLALFPEDITARPYGPDIPALRAAFAPQQGNPGFKPALELHLGNNGAAAFRTAQAPDHLIPFLEHVATHYRHLTGVQLCNASHAPGTPWTIVFTAYRGRLHEDPTIPLEILAHGYHAITPIP